MAKHTDKFNRQWHFTPAHNTDRMVRVSREVMERFIVADRILSGHSLAFDSVPQTGYFASYPRVECYILRSGNQVYTGARFGDNGPDYLSSLIHNDFVVRKLLEYLKGATDINNHSAIVELFPDLSADWTAD